MGGDVERAWEIGREAWPEFDLAKDDFAAFCDNGAEIAEARSTDLYLAAACAAGIDKAIEAFHAEFVPLIDRLAARISGPGTSPEDARQLVIARLLVGTDQSAPKIAKYRGLGSLSSWIRSVTARTLINLHKSTARARDEVGLEQSLFEQFADGADPEVDFLKQRYRNEFKSAFEEAVETLSARARNHLRHVFIDRMSIDQLGRVYGVHRSTAARRLESARAELLEKTRASLGRKLAVETNEVDSIVRLIGSKWELSISRVFGDLE